jgi:hypothetical protein
LTREILALKKKTLKVCNMVYIGYVYYINDI